MRPTARALHIEGVTLRFAGQGGVGPLSLDVAASETVVLLGPSGSGKSTLLRVIAGLEQASAGSILLGGTSLQGVPPHRRGVAWLPQRPAFYPEQTVAQQLQQVKPFLEPRRLDLAATVKLLRLEKLLDRLPDSLSGGERQRVAWAKLLLRNAPVWLLDEPFSGLDPLVRAEFRADLHLLREQAQATIVLVTHDPTDVFAFGSRVGVLEDGLLRSLGTPETLRAEPDHPFTAFCFGWNIISGRVCDGAFTGANQDFVSENGLVRLPLPASVAGKVRTTDSLTLGIRPEDIRRITPEESPSPRDGALLSGWSVLFSEPVGSGSFLTVAQGTSLLRVEVRPGSPYPVSTPTDWYIPTNMCRWFLPPS